MTTVTAPTAGTITREQICELLDACVARFERGVDTDEDRDVARVCEDALGRPHGPCYRPPTEAEVTLARARCAGILKRPGEATMTATSKRQPRGRDAMTRLVFCVEVVERAPGDPPDGGTIVDDLEISEEQVKIALLACAGFELTIEEKAILRPAYVSLARALCGQRAQERR